MQTEFFLLVGSEGAFTLEGLRPLSIKERDYFVYSLQQEHKKRQEEMDRISNESKSSRGSRRS